MNKASNSFDAASANMVLPVPGNPYNKMPPPIFFPNFLNNSLCLYGIITFSLKAFLASSSPAISLNVIPFLLGITELFLYPIF